MKLKEKRHEKLQREAINKVVSMLMGNRVRYFINDDNVIFFSFEDARSELINSSFIKLPSGSEIVKLAKEIYKNFDETSIKRAVYDFSFLNLRLHSEIQSQKLIINAKNSNVYIKHSKFENLYIQDADIVSIHKCEVDNKLNIKAQSVYFSSVQTEKIDDIFIESQKLDLYESDLNAKKITIKSDSIDSRKTNIASENEIIIENKNFDVIKEIIAPTIIYNGESMSNSDEVLMSNPIGDLKAGLEKMRNNVMNKIDLKIDETTQKQRKDLESKPITKIIKK